MLFASSVRARDFSNRLLEEGQYKVKEAEHELEIISPVRHGDRRRWWFTSSSDADRRGLLSRNNGVS